MIPAIHARDLQRRLDDHISKYGDTPVYLASAGSIEPAVSSEADKFEADEGWVFVLDALEATS